ncbi:hypothetical protein BDV98DRAFT_599548 [Pterulicium gracile]|uniref:Uncharacterized protein n=1 Tax=Pterulicium gracile TaxID=1884261 RepID=A0A5C3R7C4_9AGAR|nr:hypothetical protein BDV98DRAFT_599548 [Pterula gracilis]
MLPSAAVDLDRLLDPSYSSYKLSPTANNYLTLCVDHKGDFHDPDYRHFPISVRPSSPSRTRYNSHSPIPYYDEDEEEDIVEDEISIYYPDRAVKRSSPRHSPRSLLSSPSSSYSAFSQPSPSSCSTPLEDSYSYTSSPRRLQRHRHSPLPPIACDDEQSALFAAPPRSEADNHFVTDPEIPSVQVNSMRPLTPSPTCMNALRMQWYSVTLSMRFKVFRTKRSLRRRIFPQESRNT